MAQHSQKKNDRDIALRPWHNFLLPGATQPESSGKRSTTLFPHLACGVRLMLRSIKGTWLFKIGKEWAPAFCGMSTTSAPHA